MTTASFLPAWAPAHANIPRSALSTPRPWTLPNGRLKPQDDEIRHLRAELDRTRPERDILKKCSGFLRHSDCGSQYGARAYPQMLTQHKAVCSMSRHGNSYDNAAMESFFPSLKTECVFHERYETRD